MGWLERLLARAPRWLAEPLGRILHAFSGGLAVLRAPVPHLAKIGLQSLAIWLLIALGFHLNHLAFGIDLPFHATFLLIAFLVVGVAIPTPGMVGGLPRLLPARPQRGLRHRPRDRRRGRASPPTRSRTCPILVFGLALLGREGLSLGRVAEVTRDEQKPPGGATVKCPFCSHLEDKVVDSRESKEGDVIRRRRECLDCGKRFTSYERIDQIPHLVVKKDGRRERFDREKVMQGLLKACEKRPVPVKALEAIVERVEAMVQESPDREVPTDQIGEFLMDAAEGARQGGLRPLRLGLPRLQGRRPVHGHAQGPARSQGLRESVRRAPACPAEEPGPPKPPGWSWPPWLLSRGCCEGFCGCGWGATLA